MSNDSFRPGNDTQADDGEITNHISGFGESRTADGEERGERWSLLFILLPHNTILVLSIIVYVEYVM